MQGLAAAALVAAASLTDRWAFAHFNLPTVYDQGWGRLIRTLGYLPFWLLVGFGIHRSSSTSSTRRSALLLMLAPTLSGALSELLKLLVRRERPGPNAGEYVFRAFTDRPFSTAGLGMPSGDTIVAFAACTVLARAWPKARLLWYALAVRLCHGSRAEPRPLSQRCDGRGSPWLGIGGVAVEAIWSAIHRPPCGLCCLTVA